MDLRLTELSHGGGCGCKIAPAVLSEILAGCSGGMVPPELLVGNETADDAAVYQLGDRQALVATTDFFTPIVDDPADFGRIAATNALSDVYAMGATPILALAIVGMPVGRLPVDVIGRILEGGASVCRQAGIPIAGGHSVDVLEPLYGLVALGLVDPADLVRNSGARPGDVLVLGKPLGIGILSAALKKGILPRAGYEEMLRHTTKLNAVGIRLARTAGVHAMTDVTGFGLLGHLLEICRGSHLSATLRFGEIPIVEAALPFLRDGVATGASARNWSSYGASVSLAPDLDLWQRALLTDPQTSGGLLVACAAPSVERVLGLFHEEGFVQAAAIGSIKEGGELVTVV